MAYQLILYAPDKMPIVVMSRLSVTDVQLLNVALMQVKGFLERILPGTVLVVSDEIAPAPSPLSGASPPAGP